MKILCVCEHGNTRSVGLAYILKTLFKQEAIAVGYKDISVDTMRMLTGWADKIVVLTDEFELRNEPKFIRFDVGKDIWFNPKDQGLIHRLYKELSEHPELFDK